MKYLVAAFYKFVSLSSIESLREELRPLMKGRGIYGTMILAPEGMNATLVGEPDALRAFLADLKSREEFADLEHKESWVDSIPFKRSLIRVKNHIIPLDVDRPIDPVNRTGHYVDPQELKSWLDKNEDVVLVDTRNTYEIEAGTFKNAVHFNVTMFRHFGKKLKEHAPELKDKKVVMFCTGGIRCEKATAYAREIGIENVYQIKGGILKYFEEVGNAHYDGECFVFDHRMAVDPVLKPTDRPDDYEYRR